MRSGKDGRRMKKFQINNFGLKVLSVVLAFVVWLIIVNYDDPVITKTFSGVIVDINNVESIEKENKTYEIINDSNIISVKVKGQRSVVENMTKDYLKATADIKNITFMNTIPIEVKSTRYADRLNLIEPKTPNVEVVIEEKLDKQIKIATNVIGDVADGYEIGTIKPFVDVIFAEGPESVVSIVKEARVNVSVTDATESFTTASEVLLYDAEGEEINDAMLKVSLQEITIDVEVLETKEVPLSVEVTGTPKSGYGFTGTVICEPSSVKIAGTGNSFKACSAIRVPAGTFSIDGASENVIEEIDISKFLPDNIVLSDEGKNSVISVEAVIEPNKESLVSIPVASITINGVPDGMSASVTGEEPAKEVAISGIEKDILAYIQKGEFEASVNLENVKNEQHEAVTNKLTEGIYTAEVILNLPESLAVSKPVFVNIQLQNMSVEGASEGTSEVAEPEATDEAKEAKQM